LQKAARNTLNDERVQINLRVSKHNLSKLKARALREGMPYQTLINSILHKSVN
jgi:predicted DNA binding CopG/RHH family protein